MKYLALVIFSLFITSCAQLDQMIKESHERWVAANCNANGAYNAGLTDGLTPQTMPVSGFANNCPANLNRGELNGAYLRGFREGLSGRPQEININKNISVENKNQ